MEVVDDEDDKEDKDQMETWRQLLQIPSDGATAGIQALPDNIQASIVQAVIIMDAATMMASMHGFAQFISLLVAEVSRAVKKGQAEQQRVWKTPGRKDDPGEDEEHNALMQMPALPSVVAMIKQELRALDSLEAHQKAAALQEMLRASAFYRFRASHLGQAVKLVDDTLARFVGDRPREGRDYTDWATGYWQLLSAAFRRMMMAKTCKVSTESAAAVHKRKLCDIEELEWSGQPGLYVTARDGMMQQVVDKARLEVTGLQEPFHVAVHYQPAQSEAATSGQAAVVPAGQASWMPLAVGSRGGSMGSHEGQVDFSHFSSGFHSGHVQTELGDPTLQWYRRLRDEMIREGVEYGLDSPPTEQGGE